MLTLVGVAGGLGLLGAPVKPAVIPRSRHRRLRPSEDPPA